MGCRSHGWDAGITGGMLPGCVQRAAGLLDPPAPHADGSVWIVSAAQQAPAGRLGQRVRSQPRSSPSLRARSCEWQGIGSSGAAKTGGREIRTVPVY